MTSNNCGAVCKLAENSSNTDIRFHEVKHVWTINNFDFHEALGIDLVSPTFSAGSDPQIEWNLIVEPNGDPEAEDHISLYISANSNSTNDAAHEKIFAKTSASILDREQKEKFYMGSSAIDKTKVDEYVFSSNSKPSWGVANILKKDYYFRNHLLLNNQLTIVCRIMYSTVLNSLTHSVHRCKSALLYPDVSPCNLIENFGMLLENDKFADVVLSIKNKEYPAHKAILATRSSVFAAMFEHNFKEKETNRIIIEDMNEEVLTEMLRYIYTGKCENSGKLAGGLLAAADKYDLNQLKISCAETLFKTLSVDNAANILALADLHSVQELKFKVIEFIVARFAEVVDSIAWQNILATHIQLVNEVCKAVAGRSIRQNKRKNQDSSSECKRKRTE